MILSSHIVMVPAYLPTYMAPSGLVSLGTIILCRVIPLVLHSWYLIHIANTHHQISSHYLTQSYILRNFRREQQGHIAEKLIQQRPRQTTHPFSLDHILTLCNDWRGLGSAITSNWRYHLLRARHNALPPSQPHCLHCPPRPPPYRSLPRPPGARLRWRRLGDASHGRRTSHCEPWSLRLLHSPRLRFVRPLERRRDPPNLRIGWRECKGRANGKEVKCCTRGDRDVR